MTLLSSSGSFGLPLSLPFCRSLALAHLLAPFSLCLLLPQPLSSFSLLTFLFLPFGGLLRLPQALGLGLLGLLLEPFGLLFSLALLSGELGLVLALLV